MSYIRMGEGIISDVLTGEVVRWDVEYPQHYGASALLARGWSDAMIRDLLGAADITAVNPYFAKSARARLWCRQRVEEAEDGAEFQTRLAARKAACTETHERRTDRRSDSAPRTTDA